MSVPAVKAALHRGRARLRELAAEPEDLPRLELPAAEAKRLRIYVDHFNARNFDAIRRMIADEAQVELTNEAHMIGLAEARKYFGNYAGGGAYRARLAFVDGHAAVIVEEPDAAPYCVLVRWSAGRIVHIRDFRYARYVLRDAAVMAIQR